MRTRFDQLGKQIGEAALGPFGSTSVHYEIAPEAQYADLRFEPDPGRAGTEARERLGFLGQLASSLCVIELFSQAPSEADFRACLVKHLAFWQAREREHRTGKLSADAPVEPRLWIISARTPAGLIAKLGLVPEPGWSPGVYLFSGSVLRVGLVAANALPRVASTLLVRLMVGGPLLSHAVAELAGLPPDSFERQVADGILVRLQHVLESKPDPTPEEEEFVMIMEKSWERAREIGTQQGREEGRLEALARSILTVLRVRGIPVPDTERERILAERDPAQLERWHERAIVAPALAAVLDA